MQWYGSEEPKIRGEPLLIVSEVFGGLAKKSPCVEGYKGLDRVAREGLEPSTSAL